MSADGTTAGPVKAEVEAGRAESEALCPGAAGLAKRDDPEASAILAGFLAGFCVHVLPLLRSLSRQALHVLNNLPSSMKFSTGSCFLLPLLHFLFEQAFVIWLLLQTEGSLWSAFRQAES